MTAFKAGDKVRFRADKRSVHQSVSMGGVELPPYDGVHMVAEARPWECEGGQVVKVAGFAPAHGSGWLGSWWFEEAL